MRAIDRWHALRADERRLTLQCAGPVVIATIGLRLFALPRLLRTAARPLGAPAVTGDEIRDRVEAVNRIARYLPGATCLATSLALAWILRGRGVPAEVRIGVRKENGGLDAHAWVECDGVAVTEPARVSNRFVTAY